MSRIAICGTTGLIGSAVQRRLVADRHETISIGRRSGADLCADFAIPASIHALDLSGVDAVIHCAGVTDEDFAADPGRAFAQATLGAAALVDRMAADGVPRLGYVSSAHVYGALEGRISEASPVNPLSNYAIAHYASEQIFRRACAAALAVCIFRPCAVFGIPPNMPQFRRWSLIPFGFPRDALRSGHIGLKSSGSARRNFVAADDVASSVGLWLDKTSDTPFQVVNPVGQATLSVLEFAELCADACKNEFNRRCDVSAMPEGSSRAQPFEYVTQYPENIGRTDLKASIIDLMRIFAHERPVTIPGSGIP